MSRIAFHFAEQIPPEAEPIVAQVAGLRGVSSATVVNDALNAYLGVTSPLPFDLRPNRISMTPVQHKAFEQMSDRTGLEASEIIGNAISSFVGLEPRYLVTVKPLAQLNREWAGDRAKNAGRRVTLGAARLCQKVMRAG